MIVRRIAGVRFERTFSGIVTKSYEARGDFAVSLTYEIDTNRWTARVSSPHFYTSLRAATLDELTAWLRAQRVRHDELAEARRIREREVRRVVVRRRRRADRTALAVLGGYVLGVFVGAVAVAAKAAESA